VEDSILYLVFCIMYSLITFHTKENC